MSAGPTITFRNASSLRSTGLSPHILTGIFLQLVRSHFSRADSIEEPYLKTNLWVPMEKDEVKPDPTRSKILIEPVYRWNIEEMQKRPAIIIKRGSIKLNQHVGIGVSQSFGLSMDDLPEAGANHMAVMNGAHTFICIANHGGVVELLASEVARHIGQFIPVLQCEFGFMKMSLTQIGEVSTLEEDDTHYAVPVVVEYTYQETWKVVKQAPRLSKVLFSQDSD